MKYKKIPKEYFKTILDRLTRFEPAYVRYERVFNDIINKFSIDEKLKDLSIEDKILHVEEIIKYSINDDTSDENIKNILKQLENQYFNDDYLSNRYLETSINYEKLASLVKTDKNTQKNILWIKKLCDNPKSYKTLREKYSLLYPIEKIILCEGQTEFILLKTIFNLFDFDLDKLGILVMQAGGKNQVAKKFYQMIEYTKIPFFILLDKDAVEISSLIKPKLRKIDKLYLIKSGEFEDLIPVNVLLNTINYFHKNELNCTINDFKKEHKMVENIENIFKNYGFGEFKKAHFAQLLKKYIEKNSSKNDFETSEIVDIIRALQ